MFRSTGPDPRDKTKSVRNAGSSDPCDKTDSVRSAGVSDPRDNSVPLARGASDPRGSLESIVQFRYPCEAAR